MAFAEVFPSDKKFTEKLIEEVRRHPILYDSCEPGYKDRYEVRAAWQAIASSIGCRALSAKSRWQNLRGSYSRSRFNQSQSSGSGPSSKKKPFYLSQKMSFLEPHMQQPSRSMDDNFDPCKVEVTAEEAAVDNGSLSENSIDISLPSDSDTEPVTLTPVKQRKRVASTVDADPLKEKVARFLDLNVEGHNKFHNTDDFESLRGLLPHMAALTNRRKRTFLRKVYNLVFELLEEQDQEEENTSVVSK